MSILVIDAQNIKKVGSNLRNIDICFYMRKNELRTILKSERNNLSETEIENISQKVIKYLLRGFKWQGALVNVFLPIQKNKELNLYPLIEKIALLKGRITVNRSNFALKTMTPIHYQSDLEIKKNEYGIPEPVNGVEIEINEIDVVIVPMLGFNANGHRLGYGGGFYDRFLSQTKAACIKIGVCHTAEPITIQNIENTDISLDFLISPNGIRKFSNIT